MSGLRLIAPASVGGAAPSAPFVPVDNNAGDQAARGLLKFAETASDIADHERALKRTTDLANAGGALQTVLDQKRIELDADPDHTTRSQRFQQFAQAETAKATAGMDAETKALFIRQAQPLASGMELSIRHQARKDAVDEAVVTLRASNDDLTKKAADARNPLEREALLAQVKGNIDNALSTNILTPAQYKSELQGTLVKADQATALKMIRDNPGQAAVALAGGKALPNLDVVTREKLIDAANNESRARLSQALAIEARNDRIETKQAAALADRAGKELESRASDGTLTREWLEQARPFITKSDYVVGLKTVKGGATVDDKETLADVLPRLDREDVSKKLTEKFLANKITDQTYRALMNRNGEVLKDDGPPSPYKQGYSHVNEALAPALSFDATTAKLAGNARAEALLEYNTFADANRDAIKANPQIAVQTAQDIVRRYRLINFNEIGQAIGLPQGFQGTRENIARPDIQAAGKRVLEAFDRHEIGEAQKNLELRKLDQWDEIIRQRDQAAADAEAARKPGATPKKVP